VTDAAACEEKWHWDTNGMDAGEKILLSLAFNDINSKRI